MNPNDTTQEPLKTAEVSSIEVTLKHTSFGSYSYRCEPGDLPHTIEDALDRAKLEAGVRTKVAIIDEEQVTLSRQMERVRAKLAAAEVLEDEHAKESVQRELDGLQAQVQACAEDRSKALDVLQ